MIEVRDAVPGDVPLILSLIRELAAYEREPDAVVATEELLHRHLFRPDARAAECVIASWASEPVGFALFFHNFSTWRGRPGLYLEDLFVRHGARGRGVGRALLQHLARVAADRGCARMEWAVLDWNQPAIEFYKSLGAKPMEEWTTWRLTGEALGALGAAQESWTAPRP